MLLAMNLASSLAYEAAGTQDVLWIRAGTTTTTLQHDEVQMTRTFS
jgi:hypothetical protein